MDAWEHRALIVALVVLGCMCAVVAPSVGAVDAGSPGAADDGASPAEFIPLTASGESGATGLLTDEPTSLDATAVWVMPDETDDQEDGTNGDENGGEGSDDGQQENTTDSDDAGEGNDTDDVGPDIHGPTPHGYDTLVLDIELHENGSASWTLEYRYRLDGDNNATDRWEAVRDDLEADSDAHLETVESNWSARVGEASSETGREMAVDGFNMTLEETATPHETGYVQYQFQWEEFARVELNRLEVGDAFGDLELDERTQLIVRWPAGYEATTTEPLPNDLREHAAIWNGEETDFLENEPVIELLGQPESEEETESEGETVVPLSWLLVAALAGATLTAVGGLLGWRRGWIGRPVTNEATPEDAQTATDPAGNPSSAGTQTVGAAPVPDTDLLSNEERVVHLLERHGGRMKQQDVVGELGWTEAKTSQVVSGLRENGDLEAFRVGRENVLTLPETGAPDPDEAGDTDHDDVDGTGRGP